MEIVKEGLQGPCIVFRQEIGYFRWDVAVSRQSSKGRFETSCKETSVDNFLPAGRKFFNRKRILFGESPDGGVVVAGCSCYDLENCTTSCCDIGIFFTVLMIQPGE